ncbi:copper transporter [Corynebacterium terpenotabidum]|uniref:Copper transporter n=1 Tax=Corynebacterium terpenotabidum Y-11 TaxID=1200352 RepID=S4XDS1_9CORY|nr:copper transporter [Corynebacterium terpenotabidum]AGP30684.1 hypothetical protein A606_05175 [Corynebacterium terpenotabidum Y-11]
MSGPRILGAAAAGVAAGTLLGFYVLAPNIEGGPGGDDQGLQDELSAAVAEQTRSAAELDADDAVLGPLAADAVRGDLDGRSVLVVTAGTVTDELLDAQRALLDAAGAENAGTLRLSDSALSQDRADALKSLATSTLPAGAQLSEDRRDPGYHLGQLLGQALRTGDDQDEEATVADRDLVLGSLDKGGFLQDGIPDLTSADAVVVLTDGTTGYAGSFVADLAAGLDDTTGGVVLAGDRSSTDDGAAVAVLRDDRADTEQVSTVDNVDRVAGRITVVRALDQQLSGDAGSYGAAENAAAPTL